MDLGGGGGAGGNLSSLDPPVHESASAFYGHPIIPPLRNETKFKGLQEIVVTRPSKSFPNLDTPSIL